MDVRPANVNVVKRAEVAGSGVSQRAGDRKGEKESDRRKEKPAFGPIGDMLVKKPANARMVQHPEDDCGSHKNRQSEQPGPQEHECALSYKHPDFNRVGAAGQEVQGAENGGWPSCSGQGE